MNLYLIVFLLLAGASLAEWKKPEWEERLYPACWVMMTVLLCLRFGQGTDYATYHGIYETIPAVIDWSQGYICGFYPEIGWRLISALFKVLHAPFWVFTMVLGLAEMLLLHRFLKKYVPMKVAGLFLSYPVLFMVYMVSGLRQGLAICIFLGAALPFYLERKWVPYIAAVLLAASFHKVGYAWLILVIVSYIPIQWMLLLTGLAIAGGLILQISMVEQFIVGILPVYHVKQFLLEGSPSLSAIGERLTSFAVLAVFYVREYREGHKDTEIVQIAKAYMCGVAFYMLMSGNAYYASRYGVIFKVVECVLIIYLIKRADQLASIAACFFFVLTLVMGFKNLNAAVNEGGYDRLGRNVFTYPYVSVLNKDEINEYFDYSEKLDRVYKYNIEDQQLWMIED